MATTRKRIGSKKPTATVSSGTIPGENVKNSDPDSSTGSDSVCSYCRFLCLLAVFMVCAFAVYIWCLECPLGELADFEWVQVARIHMRLYTSMSSVFFIS